MNYFIAFLIGLFGGFVIGVLNYLFFVSSPIIYYTIGLIIGVIIGGISCIKYYEYKE